MSAIVVGLVVILPLSSCATKSAEEPEEPTKAPATASSDDSTSDDDTALPKFDDGLGLLDPRDLTKLPTEVDMQASIPAESKPVLATPPVTTPKPSPSPPPTPVTDTAASDE